MKFFKNRNVLRFAALMVAAVILFCTQGFASSSRRSSAERANSNVKLLSTDIEVEFRLTEGTPDEFTYDGKPHGLALTAYVSGTDQKLDLKQGVDFIVSYSKVGVGALDDGVEPIDAGSYQADYITGLPNGYEWDWGTMIPFEIKPLSVAYTVTGLTQYAVYSPNGYEVTVTFDTPLEKGKDYAVKYHKQKDDGSFETNGTDSAKGAGIYKVEIMDTVSNYKPGNRKMPPPDEELIMEVRTNATITIYYNNKVGDFADWQDSVSITKKVEEDMFYISDVAEPKVPENLKFAGWYRDMDGDKKYSEGDTLFLGSFWVKSDLDLVARWTASEDANLKSLSVLSVNGAALELCGADYTKPLAFSEDTTEYYLRVGADTNTVLLTAETNMSEGQISVENGGKSVSAKDGRYEIRLSEAVNASANEVKVISTAPDKETTKEYIVYIQRMTAPALTLNYGNSPYGMIMKSQMSSSEKTAAKAEFDKTFIYNGVKAGMRYGDEAWASDAYRNYKGTGTAYNGDKDDTAIFIYQKQAFKDPGFIATDSIGRPVSHELVKRSMRVISISAGLPDFAAAGTPIPINVQRESDVFTELEDLIVRPGVYEMTYSFTDELTGETIMAVRKVIVISEVGDAYLDGKVDDKDVSTIEKEIYYLNTTDSLYKFRIVDVCQDGNFVININDAGKIEQKELEPEAHPKYYLELK